MESVTSSFTLSIELVGAMYEELLGYATGECNQALLVVRHPPVPPLSSRGSEVLRKLQPFLVKQEETSEWPGTVLFGHTASVSHYTFDLASARVLRNAANSLYSWLQPELPEDLCLLRP